ncbi:MAG: plasmid mobilization relaxosome protein MobC [Halomonas sp.]|uniref:plasmid mobilization relaxosome protein MobC n=1 Tax=Halomonas sp. AOP42-B2-16 TaxID=3457673 RepID=UPI003FB73725
MDEKIAWTAFCKSHEVSEATMLRDMIARITGEKIPSSKPDYQTGRSNQVNIRLNDDGLAVLDVKAQSEGYRTRVGWTTAVVLAALHREPVLTDAEVSALRESNRELAAIGRNLNQVARALNIEFRESDRIKQESIEQLAERIEQHKDQVASLLSRNMNRWGE